MIVISFYKFKIYYEGWEQCQLTNQVNNHLGYLYNMYGHLIHFTSTSTKLNITQHHKLNTVFTAKNVLDQSFALELRAFLQAVPIDLNRKMINDATNLPLSNAFFEKDPLTCLENPTGDPNEWIWENYSYSFWRLAPKSLNAFYGSPIPKLIHMLDTLIRSLGSFNGISFDTLECSTWVIQRMIQGQKSGLHTDGTWTKRQISFIYYITPEWFKRDGGGLHLLNIDEYKFRRINPDFNTLVIWPAKDDHYRDLHYVETVHASNDKPRIALVGFFDLK